MINHIDDHVIKSIDYKMENNEINENKKHPYSFLPADLGLAKFFLGDKIKNDIYAILLNPLLETYIKEGVNYNYDRKDLMDALAYARTLSVVEDVNSDVFKRTYMKKKTKLSKENISDDDAKKEITEILTKNISKKEIKKYKNLQSYLMKCRNPLIGYSVDPNDKNRFTNKDAREKFNKKVAKYSIEDITLNKLFLMVFRDYFEAFLSEKKQQLGWENFQVKIANNYDNFMGGSHLIIKFRKIGAVEPKHFVLHINTQGTKKKIKPEVIPYDYSSYLNTTGKGKPIKMSMKTLDWGNKKMLYKFLSKVLKIIEEKGHLDKKSVMEAFDNAGNEKSTEHVKKKIVKLLSEDLSAVA